MKPATEILLSAAFALTPPENWGTGWVATTDHGEIRSVHEPDAARWCVIGACMAAAVALGHGSVSTESIKSLIGKACGCRDVADFNDTHTHAEVLDALYRAAEIAENG